MSFLNKKNNRKREHDKTLNNEEHEFSEELADGGERNEIIKKQENPTRGVRLI